MFIHVCYCSKQLRCDSFSHLIRRQRANRVMGSGKPEPMTYRSKVDCVTSKLSFGPIKEMAL